MATDDAGAEIQKTVLDIVTRMDEQSLEAMWKSVLRLQKLGNETVPILRKEMRRFGEQARLGCAKVLIHLGDLETRQEAFGVLVGLIESSKVNALRAAAVQILGEHGDPEEVLDFLGGVLDRETDPQLIIVLARTLWELDNVPEARTKLIDLLHSRDPAVKNEAAIALAEIDYFEGDVREVLRELRREPTLRGRLASSLFRSGQLARQLDRALEAGDTTLPGTDPEKLLQQKEKTIRELEVKLEDLRRGGGPGGSDFPVIEEVLSHIQELHVERDSLERRSLIVAALKGIAKSLDHFSSFLDPEETKKFLTDISGEYCGIGAQVGKPAEDAPLEILKPIYGGPAHEQNILTNDQILEVDGVPTRNLSLNEIVNRLKGKPDTRVTLKVYRRGWDQPRDIELVRRVIEVPSLAHQMLPGKIGLIKLYQFGERSDREFQEAVIALEDDGMEGLVIDLRNNPGGLLQAALSIVDLFVEESDLPIVTQRGPKGEENIFPNAGKRPDYPLVILVNERSASASEIVAGALKDFHRATLVGKKTFGKGSVQRLIPLSPKAQDILGGPSRLRLTVQYYYLPSGRLIHTVRDESGQAVPGKEGGVVPDVVVDAETYPAWLVEEIEQIRYSKKLSDYVTTNFEEIRDLMENGDGGSVEKYPGFKELHESLETRATEDQVRQILRFHLRRKVEDSVSRELAGDFQDDRQLQQSILEVLKLLNRDPAEDPHYAWLKGETRDTPKREQ